ncbi:hypothetical protein EDC04DRAFT_2895332 [Pisolithus marmoratus]|nr:hypothetical protein EDC04DRAFT_2895332 [Pisolithus marmoratus]
MPLKLCPQLGLLALQRMHIITLPTTLLSPSPRSSQPSKPPPQPLKPFLPPSKPLPQLPTPL